MNKSLFLFLASIFLFGCKSSTAPETGPNGASGTILFWHVIDAVATTTLGSATKSDRLTGMDPQWTPDGKILYDLWGEYTTDQKEHLMIANADGTGARVVVNMQKYNSSYYAHPQISRDGRYVSFNYYDDVNYVLGTTLGTLIYDANTGQQYAAIPKLFDGSWTPDGGLVVAGDVFTQDYGGNIEPGGYNGLYLYAAGFTSAPTAIGSNLSAPSHPMVSPDGKRVAFAMNKHLWTINMDGSGLKQITTGPNEETYSCWSPNGSSLAVLSGGDFGPLSGSGTAIAIVPSNPGSATTIDASANVWVKDNGSPIGVMGALGMMSWK